jgi:hypothetical protein
MNNEMKMLEAFEANVEINLTTAPPFCSRRSGWALERINDQLTLVYYYNHEPFCYNVYGDKERYFSTYRVGSATELESRFLAPARRSRNIRNAIKEATRRLSAMRPETVVRFKRERNSYAIELKVSGGSLTPRMYNALCEAMKSTGLVPFLC